MQSIILKFLQKIYFSYEICWKSVPDIDFPGLKIVENDLKV